MKVSIHNRWQEKYFQAKTALAGREEKLAAVGDLIERDLLLLGCTAIEDKLQAGVPEAIERLANAGIRIWVLTGDKQVLLHHSALFFSELRPAPALHADGSMRNVNIMHIYCP